MDAADEGAGGHALCLVRPQDRARRSRSSSTAWKAASTRASLQALGVNGRPLLQNLRWQFQPWWLPLLRASFHLDGGGEQLRLDGRAAFVIGGINLASTHVAGGLKALLDLGGLAYAPVDGEGRIDIDSLKLRGGLPELRQRQGRKVHNLAFTLGKDPLPLGDFKADFSNQSAGTISGKEASSWRSKPCRGPLDASGEAHLQADHSYDYDLRLKPKAGADPMLVNLLDSLGRPGPAGHRAATTGNLATIRGSLP